ncbi:fatty acid--CoA ligase family protein [Lysinibacillus sp. HST-98]|uniref:fatty acid--CoA ligase family protein n=1 Tax=Lysinibacillus TaxID=400634 RepID=UPI0001DA5020|nr:MULTISPECIES: fatty acid--CoA ligase family protein [Lysinibacillus]EFI67760.1 long-chain-fatty-acid--CoA ligase [Lysinibacillus fusiformis ZC1]EKU42142.1 long-chain-fatty-acid--CoA ligase [Lysinibacillus fusiformis ZB2]MBL3731752.1 fatty acid--CoA ligase family protein [Lysinibacillus sp. HST-98]MBU5253627.1 fatty acid--CoA ligase family protein [Lysinibacillus capsici]MED4699678.1 fatty acid--CoA ligase family protein [Lysinibacillus capsici]
MNLVSRVRQQATEQPEKVAYHFMGKDTTYGEFEHTVGRFAKGLQDLGVEKGDHVAFLLGNTPHYLIALYATMRLGATAIPVNPIYTPDEISYILHNGDVKAVIALDMLLPLVEKGVQAFPQVKTFIVCETTPDIAEKVAALSPQAQEKTHLFTHVIAKTTQILQPVEVAEDDNAIILYTSGTTGSPKGAMLTHGNVYSNARDVAHYLGINAEDRVIATLPVFHVFALTVVVNAPLLSGATVLLAPRFSPSDIFALAREQKATVFAGVPTMYNFLYQLPEGNPEDFSTIRLAISGGASLPVALLHNFEQKFNVRVSEGYGLSEASPVTCFNPLDRDRKAGSIGTSISNVENRVVDVNGQEVPVGEVGELIVRGPNVMKGYYKMPEETAMAIRDGWLYTGDLAKVDEEGYFYIVDRKKDMIIVGGFNVYPREVEEVLFAHNNIVEAAVVGFPDPNLGEAVHAYVVLKEVAATTTDDLLSYCAKHMVKYKVPKVIEILDELPKNTTGKILRRSLKEKV